MEKNKGFQKQESSDSHIQAVARYVTAPANADQIVAILKNALLRINLNIQRAWPVACVIMEQRRRQTRKLE